MNTIGLSSLLTALTTGALGAFVRFKNPNLKLYRIFSLYSFSISAWSFFVSVQVYANNHQLALLAARGLNLAAVFIPVLFLHFVAEFFTAKKQTVTRVAIPILYGVSLSFGILSAAGYLVTDVAPKYDLNYLMVPSGGYIFLVIFFVCCVLWGLLKLFNGYLEAGGVKRNQIKYLLIGSIFGYAGGLNNFLILYDVAIFPIHPYGNYAILAYVLSMAYAIVQHRLLDIDLVVKRSLIYALLLLMLLVPCYLLLIFGQAFAFGQIDYGFSLILLLLLIVVGFLFPKLRFRTEDALERVLFKKKHDYRETLLRSSKDMISVIDLDTLGGKLVRTISSAMGVEKASLYLTDEVKGNFGVKASAGLDIDQFKDVLLLRDDPLVQRFLRRPEVLVREELEMSHNGRQAERELSRRLNQLEAEVSLPLVTQERLIGILNLGHKEGREMYSTDDLEVLSALTNQAAVAIENARLYQNLKQSQRVLQRADRLSSLGMLTAGLAHEIRNPLVAIRTFTQLLPERYQDTEFRCNFQSLALKEVDRICGLINDLLNFARPSAPNVAAEDINEIVQNVARILETEAKEKDVRIAFDLASNLPKIFVDKEQMKQVFMNVILNAIQSIDGGGVVEVFSRAFSQGAPHQYVQVGIHDSGVGIPQKDLENIFNPFFTTKKGGSGLGLSITHQIVQEHAGYMYVESQLGQGATFFINLPVSPLVRKGATPTQELNEKNLGH
jgi:signal transduction histidine kinase